MNYSQQERDRTIALAALLQSVHLVHNIAVTGQADQLDINTLLNSLIVTDADTTEAVYGTLSNLKTGLEQLHIQLVVQKSKHELTQVQYASANRNLNFSSCDNVSNPVQPAHKLGTLEKL